MSKKIWKILLYLVAVGAAMTGIFYLISNRKTKENKCEADEDFEIEEEHLDAIDALDLSSLKFSRHYVDLR